MIQWQYPLVRVVDSQGLFIKKSLHFPYVIPLGVQNFSQSDKPIHINIDVFNMWVAERSGGRPKSRYFRPNFRCEYYLPHIPHPAEQGAECGIYTPSVTIFLRYFIGDL